jgi:uncharacterized membrane protein
VGDAQKRDRRGLWLTLAGFLVVTGIALYDVTLPDTQIIIGVVLVGPVLVALTGEPRATMLVAAYASLAAWASVLWNHDLHLAEYWIRGALVTFGSAACYAGARARRSEQQLGDALRERESVAATLEAALQPATLPQISGWQLAELYRPVPGAARVGGDFCDAYRVSDGWAVVVGDIVGHGAEAAARSALVRYTLRTAATLTGSIDAAVRKLDRDLRELGDASPCALCCVHIPQGAGGRIVVLVAGAPAPLLVRDGTVQAVGATGPLVGAFEDAQWKPVTLTLAPGEVLTLQSDGLQDLVGPERRLGQDGLRDGLLKAAGADDAIARVERALASFGGEQRDDMLLLAISRSSAPRPTPVRSGR